MGKEGSQGPRREGAQQAHLILASSQVATGPKRQFQAPRTALMQLSEYSVGVPSGRNTCLCLACWAGVMSPRCYQWSQHGFEASANRPECTCKSLRQAGRPTGPANAASSTAVGSHQPEASGQQWAGKECELTPFKFPARFIQPQAENTLQRSRERQKGRTAQTFNQPLAAPFPRYLPARQCVPATK